MLEKFNNSKLPFYLVIATTAFFILYFSLITYYYRLGTADDIKLFSVLKVHGFFGSLSFFYYSIPFRWMPYLYFNTIFLFAEGSLLGAIPYIRVFYAIYLLLFIFIAYSFAGILTSKSRILERFSLSGIILICFYFLSPFPIETWFWLSAALMYNIPVIFFLIGILMLMKKNYFYIICGLVAGSGIETLAITFVTTTIAIMYFSRLKNIHYLFFALSICIALIINILSPGFSARLQGLETESFNGLSIIEFIGFFLQKRFLIALAAGLSLSCVVKILKVEISSGFGKLLLIYSIAVFIITVAPFIISYGSIGSPRSLQPLLFPFFGFFIFFSKYLKNLTIARFALTGLIILPMVYFMIKPYMRIDDLESYDISYRNRHEILAGYENCEFDEIIRLPPLKDPLIIAFCQLSNNPEDYFNYRLKELYKLNCKVASEAKTENK
jgi:hypothetical protein